MKTTEVRIFAEKEDDDEEIFNIATQVEREVLENDLVIPSICSGNISYSEFQVVKAQTSTQVPSAQYAICPPPAVSSQSQQHPMALQYKILQNRCIALERQLTNLRAKGEQDSKSKSQFVAKHTVQNRQLLEELQTTQRENIEMRQRQLITLSQRAKTDVERENEELREKAKKLTKLEQDHEELKLNLILIQKRDNEKDKRQVSREDIRQIDLLNALKKTYRVKIEPSPRILKIESLIPPKLYVERLHFMLTEFLLLSKYEKESFEICLSYFQEMVAIISKVCAYIDLEENSKPVLYFSKADLIELNAETISIEYKYHLNEQSKNFYQNRLFEYEGYFPEKVENYMNPTFIYPDEKDINKRLAMGIFASFAEQSYTMCELIVSYDVSFLDIKENQPFHTILDVVANTMINSILPSRQLLEYTGFAEASANVICIISRHYSKFSNHEFIDKLLAYFYKGVLLISQNKLAILVNLSDFIINVSRGSKCERLLSQLCDFYPTNRFIFKKYRMIQVHPCACALQTLFLLISQAFPFDEEVPDYRIESLFKFTANINIIAYHILTFGCHMKFIPKMEDFELKNSCKCFLTLIAAVVFLNKKVIEYRFDLHQRYHLRIKNTIRSFLSSILMFMPYMYLTETYVDFKMIQLALMQFTDMIHHGKVFKNIFVI